MHMKVLYNERLRQTECSTSVSVATQTDPAIFEDADEETDEETFHDAAEGSTDYSFITDKTTVGAERVVSHPKSVGIDHWRLGHPNSARANATKSTYRTLHAALNDWVPDGKYCALHSQSSSSSPEDILQRSLIDVKESPEDHKVILAHEHAHKGKTSHCLKVVLFNTSTQEFITRSVWPDCPHSHRFHQARQAGWRVETTTILATEEFFTELKQIITSI
jgi:hypothetical protein